MSILITTALILLFFSIILIILTQEMIPIEIGDKVKSIATGECGFVIDIKDIGGSTWYVVAMANKVKYFRRENIYKLELF